MVAKMARNDIAPNIHGDIAPIAWRTIANSSITPRRITTSESIETPPRLVKSSILRISDENTLRLE